jgi:hypothetical protein
MQPLAVSRVSTMVDVDLGDRSHAIYIAPASQASAEVLQMSRVFTRVVASCGHFVILMSNPPRHVF